MSGCVYHELRVLVSRFVGSSCLYSAGIYGFDFARYHCFLVFSYHVVISLTISSIYKVKNILAFFSV